MNKLLSEFHRKLMKLFNYLTRPSATGFVPLSIDTAEKYYGGYEDVKIHKYIREETDLLIPKAKSLPDDKLINFQPFRILFEAVMIDTTNPFFSFCNNHLFDDQRRAIYEPNIDLSYIKGVPLPKCEKIPGTVAYLSNSQPNHYGHWLLYTLPFIIVYRHFLDPKDIDFYYIGDVPSISEFIYESLDALNIRKEQIINYPCRADRSMTVVKHKITQFDNTQGFYSDVFSSRFVRNLFPPQINNSSFPKRLYVKRGKVKYRKVINEEEVLDYLRTLGFTPIVMDGRTMQEQSNIFASAEAFIAPQGSALVNLLFAREGTKVIEIIPSGFDCPANYELACYSNCDYYYMESDRIENDDIYNPGTTYAQPNIKVNMQKLKNICELAGIT